MKWQRIIKESGEGETKTIPVELTTRDIKLIQNYLNKGKSLNDPSNKECLTVVIKMLNDIVDNSNIEELDTYISNFFFENFGIEVEIDPYGENSSIELGKNGLIPLSNCNYPKFGDGEEYSDLIQGGFWDEHTGELSEGFIDVDDFNLVLKETQVGNGLDSIQLKKEGNVAKLLLNFN